MLREYLRTAPWGVVGAVQGLFFGLFYGVFTARQHHESWVGVVVTVVVSGAFFGLVMGLFLRRQRRRHPDPTPTLVGAERRRAERAAVCGPVPSDPEQREDAAAVTRHQLELLGRGRTRALIVFTVVLLLDLVIAVTTGQWWSWLFAVLFVVLIVQVVHRPVRLQRRLALLTADGAAPSR